VEWLTKLNQVVTTTTVKSKIYVTKIIVCFLEIVEFKTRCHQESYDIERVQRTALKVILGQSYTDYASALNRVGLDTLFDRREKRCLTFGLKCIKHPKHKRMFPLGETSEDVNLRVRNKFKVNFARKSTYQKSAIPYIQNMLNVHSKKE
jgi:hypothetical protein